MSPAGRVGIMRPGQLQHGWQCIDRMRGWLVPALPACRYAFANPSTSLPAGLPTPLFAPTRPPGGWANESLPPCLPTVTPAGAPYQFRVGAEQVRPPAAPSTEAAHVAPAGGRGSGQLPGSWFGMRRSRRGHRQSLCLPPSFIFHLPRPPACSSSPHPHPPIPIHIYSLSACLQVVAGLDERLAC